MAENTIVSQNLNDNQGAYALMRELQHMLYKIARSAELKDPQLLQEIQKEADIALRLIDSYLLTTSVDGKQIQIDLSPVGIGSLLHETAYEVRASSGIDVEVTPKVLQPVMTNILLLKNFLFSVGYFISKTNNSTELKFCSFKAKDGEIGVGVLSKNFNVTSKELKKALNNTSNHMPLSKHTSQSAIMLIIADAIANALGSKLSVKKAGNSKGFSLLLPKSEQLALV